MEKEEEQVILIQMDIASVILIPYGDIWSVFLLVDSVLSSFFLPLLEYCFFICSVCYLHR